MAGMAYLVGNDFSAELVASLAKSFEVHYPYLIKGFVIDS